MNNPIDPQSILFLQDRYIEHLRVRHYTDESLYGRNKRIRYFRTYCEELGISRVSQITRSVVLHYQSYLYHYKKDDGNHLTIGTQRSNLAAVRQFFSWLTTESHVIYNPASDLQMPRKEYRLPKAILNKDEVEKILSVPDTTDCIGLKDRAILELLYSTGIRRMEVCNLDIDHIDFDRGLLQVVQGKGRKDRFVPVGERALHWVDQYIENSRPQFYPSRSERALFVNMNGKRTSPGRLGSHVHDIIKKANIGKTGSCHLFRHTFATLMLENGCDVRHVQAMLGHSSLESTQIYTHVSVQFLKEAHNRHHPAKQEK